MRKRSPRYGERKLRKAIKKRGAALLTTHASPYVPSVDVHGDFVTAPRDFDGDTDTELMDYPFFSSLSPAVWVSPAITGPLIGRAGREPASPQVQIVQDSAAAAAVDVGFWDGATVTPVSDDSDPAFGDASQ